MTANHITARWRQRPPAARRWRQIATTTVTFIAVLSMGTAAAAIADAQPKDPAVQQAYQDCISQYAQRSKTWGLLEYFQAKYDCCIGAGLHWKGGEWNNPSADCYDDSGNLIIGAPPPRPTPPPSAVIPPGLNQTGIQ